MVDSKSAIFFEAEFFLINIIKLIIKEMLILSFIKVKFGGI